MPSCGVRTYPTGPTVGGVTSRLGPPGRGAAGTSAAMLGSMIDAFLVEVGAVCAEPGEQLGTLVEVQRTERFRIAALSPAAAETAGMQLFTAAAARQRRVVRDPWVRAGLQGPDEPALN